MDTKAGAKLLMWRDAIVAEAKTWLRTPYHHKARIKGVGVDCGALIYEVYKQVLGIPHEAFPNDYAEDWGLHRDNNELYLNFIMPYVVPVAEPQKGDLVVFKFGRAYAHGTIYIGDNKVIHAYGMTSAGSVLISNLKQFRLGSLLRPHKKFGLDSKWL